MMTLTDSPRPAARWRALAVAALVLASLAAPAHAQQTGFVPGTWRFDLVYDPGGAPECSSGYLTTQVAVDRRGLVSGYLTDPIVGGYYVSGSLAPDGTVRRLVADGPDQVRLEGALSGETGAGRWRSRDYACRGTWTARLTGR